LGPLRCPCHRVPTRSSPSAVWAVQAGVWLETEVLGRTCRCWVRDVGSSRTRWRSAQNIGVGSYRICILVILPGVFRVRGGCQRWDSPVVLVLCFPCFDVLCTPTALDKTRGGGLPTFAGVVLAGVLVNLAFEVVFAAFDVRSHSCSCLLAVDRQVVGTHSVGRCVQAVFTAFRVLGGAH